MITAPRDALEQSQCALLLWRKCGVRHTLQTRYVAKITPEGAMTWVVAFDGWIGKTAFIHVARNDVEGVSNAVPRSFARAVFEYAFNQAGLQVVVGLVRGDEDHVLRMDTWLGFKEAMRLPGAHERGQDLVVMTMWRHQCRWLSNDEVEHGQERATCA